MDRLTDTARALADRTRVRTVMMLDGAGDELCLCQIIDVLGLAPSTVSQHLAVLYRAGLVERRKEGRWHFFKLPADPEPMVGNALDWARAALADDRQVAEDAAHLAGACKKDRRELAACYRTAPTTTRKEPDDELLRIES
ncbi:MAG: metalloregulator ArsR/SmtB family transcription factor [Alphaproteobacteria bacterium]|nr:metalloregulator ArsR/SmtB family transcription factor [Alphaproteobacteria bacterium]